MKRLALFGSAALALTSAWALAESGPESLLPPGFDKPAPKAAPTRAPAPASAPAPAAAPAPRAAGQGATVTAPVVQRLPSDGGGDSGAVSSAPAAATASSIKLPPLDVLAKMSSEELTDLLGLRPKFDIPAGAKAGCRRGHWRTRMPRWCAPRWRATRAGWFRAGAISCCAARSPRGLMHPPR